MTDLFFKKRVLLAELEATYNTDPVPVAADAIETTNLRIQPYAGPTVQKTVDRVAWGGYEDINVAPNSRVTFEVYLAASGDAVDTAPNYGKLLQACALAETVSASTSVTYDPISAISGVTNTSVTLYFYHDGNVQQLSGCRGNVTLEFTAGALPKLSFDFLCLYNRPTSVALPTPAPVNVGSVVAITNTNTPTFSLFADSTHALVGMTANLGNNLVHIDIPGKEEVFVSDRDVTGQITFIQQLISDKDWYADAIESHAAVTLGALQVIHGTVATNILQLDAAQVQITNPQEGERDSLSTMTFDTKYLPSSSGDDDISVQTR